MKNSSHIETFALVLFAVAVSHYLQTPTAKTFLMQHQGINDLINSLMLGAAAATRIVFKYKAKPTPPA